MKKSVRKKRNIKQLVIGLFLMCACVIAVVFFWNDIGRFFADAQTAENVEQKVEKKFARAIDGVLVESLTSSTVFAVMLDNAPEAWPHEGLHKAQVVWEIPVEGARTRLMAFFDSAVVSSETIIGPVRSVRPYFLDIASGFGAYVIHVGGSPTALDMISEGFIDSLNEFSRGQYFWRDKERYAPHNVLTSGEKLMDALEDRSIGDSEYVGWRFGEVESEDQISPSFTFGELQVSWILNDTDDGYVRMVNGKEFVDADGEKIVANNVIFMMSDMHVIDGALRREIETVGEGKAVVFRAGERVEGTWSRFKTDELIRWFDAEGEEIELSRGVTWIEVLPVGWKLKITSTM